MRPFVLLSLFVPALLLGCASTYVKKNPGPHDQGIRYNLPKPYLLVQTAKVANPGGTTFQYKPGLVSIELQMKPDYSEEYSIHVRSGVGINKTSVQLDEGWKLVQVNFNIDSQTSENVTAVADAITKLTPAKAPGGKSESMATPPSPAPPKPLIAHAHNVPLGYYESVIGTDSCGKKQFQGWRYVGFLPFEACPTAGCGTATANCADAGLFGLVYERGMMVFKPLPAIAAEDVVTKAAAK